MGDFFNITQVHGLKQLETVRFVKVKIKERIKFMDFFEELLSNGGENRISVYK